MPHFNGSDYASSRDDKRLGTQHERIKQAVAGGQWWTLDEISDLTGDPPASVSAQLRHLRKPRFGAHVVDKRFRGDPANGLWEYRVQ